MASYAPNVCRRLLLLVLVMLQLLSGSVATNPLMPHPSRPTPKHTAATNNGDSGATPHAIPHAKGSPARHAIGTTTTTVADTLKANEKRAESVAAKQAFKRDKLIIGLHLIVLSKK